MKVQTAGRLTGCLLLMAPVTALAMEKFDLICNLRGTKSVDEDNDYDWSWEFRVDIANNLACVDACSTIGSVDASKENEIHIDVPGIYGLYVNRRSLYGTAAGQGWDYKGQCTLAPFKEFRPKQI